MTRSDDDGQTQRGLVQDFLPELKWEMAYPRPPVSAALGTATTLASRMRLVRQDD